MPLVVADSTIVEVNGRRFDMFSDYEIGSDLLIAADGFRLSVPMPGDGPSRQALRDTFAPGTAIKVYIVRNGNKSLQMTGLVDEREVEGERPDGTKMHVMGRDLAQHLTDSDCDPLLGIQGAVMRHTALVPETDLLFTGNIFSPDFSQARVRPLDSDEVEPGFPGSRASKDQSSVVFVPPVNPNMTPATQAPKSRVVTYVSHRGDLNPYTTSTTFVETRNVETIVETQAANPTFSDLLRQLVSPWGIPVVCDASAARDIFSGRTATVPATRRATDAARNLGLPPGAYQPSVVNKALANGQPVDTLLGVTTSTSGRTRFANGMTSSDIDRLTIQEAKPHVGEKIWEFIERHARRLGLMVWFSPDGKLILSSPNYGSAPLYRFVKRLKPLASDPNNVLHSSGVDRTGDRCSHVTVYGKGGGRSPERSPYTSTAIDTELPFYRPKFMQDDSITSVDGAENRAVRDVSHMRAKGFEYTCTVADHGQGDALYAVDNMAEVLDEVVGVSGQYYVTARVFKRALKADSTHTQLRMMPKGAIEL